MSDSRQRYYGIKKELEQLLPEQWQKCESRMINLSLMISAIAGAKELTLPELAAEMPLAAQYSSLVQRQRRWLMNEQMQEREVYEPIIKPYLQAVSKATIPLLIDTTDMGLNCHALTVALGYQRRGLPIAWECGRGSRGHTGGDRQVALLEYVRPLLGEEADVIVLGDGEFGHVQLINWLEQEPAWDYCLRAASDTYIWYEDQWQRLDSFAVGSGEVIWLEEVYLTKDQPTGPLNILLTWDDRQQRLVVLVTNLSTPDEALYWYEKRYWIEPLFGDIKGHGFDLQTSRLTHPARLSRLMLAIALAYLWLCFLGVRALLIGQAKLVDRSDRRDRSIFSIGRLWLKRRLKLDLPFPVSFWPFPFKEAKVKDFRKIRFQCVILLQNRLQLEEAMSDARKMNLSIARYLKQILGGTVQDNHIYALALMMTGLIRGKWSHFDEIGRKSGHGSGSKFPSRVKLIHRFIKNKHITYESHFMPFIEEVLASLGLNEFRLSIDSSKVGRGILILAVGLVYKKRVISLAWMLYKGCKGHSSVEKQLELLKQVSALLPAGAAAILTGDGEFDGTGVIEWLKTQPTWHYALRTAKTIIVRGKDETQGQSLETLAPSAGADKFLETVFFTRQEVGPVNIAILWHQADQEHIYLVTDAQSLAQCQQWYRRRFNIETRFSDSKSRGFGLDKSGVRHPDRMARFVIAVFLAYIWMIYLGVLAIQSQQLGLIARTDRFFNSLFQLGRAFLDRILEEGWDIPVSVALPDPRSFVHPVLV